MKKYYLIFLLILNIAIVCATNINISVNQSVIGDTLYLTYRLTTSTHNQGFRIGSSDFVVKINGNDLDINNARLHNAISLGTSYLPLEIVAAEQMIGLYVRLDHQKMNSTKILIIDTLLATVSVPIINKCGFNKVDILTDAGSVNQLIVTPYTIEFIRSSLTGISDSIKNLNADFSNIEPTLFFENNKIVSSVDNNNTWYFNGEKLIGISGSAIEPVGLGDYSVEIKNECNSIFSKPLSLKVNNIEKNIDNHFEFQVSPNPFNEQVKISFTLNETSHVKIEVFDILGVKKAEILNDFYQNGKHEVVWATSKFNLNPGHYFFRINANGKSTTIKAIYTEQ